MSIKKYWKDKIYPNDFRLILFFYLIFQAVNLVTLRLAPIFVKSGDWLPPKDFPPFLSSLGNFDGYHYVTIAFFGYGDFQQAFFPFFPLIINLISKSGIPVFYAGLLVVNIAFFIAMVIFLRLFTKVIDRKTALWFLLFLISFPTSFFLVSIYTESLFLLLYSLSLYFFDKKKYLLSLLTGYFLGLTRVVGVFVGFSFLPYLKKILFKKICLVVAPAAGLATYSLYLLQKTGDPFNFFSALSSFGVNRSSHIVLLPQTYYRYLKVFLETNWTFTHFLAFVEVFVFTVVLIVLIRHAYFLYKTRLAANFNFLLGILLFSLANILLSSLTGTLTSTPRYALLSISFFVALSLIKTRYLKPLILVTFFIFHIIFLAYFSRGYFIG